MDTKLKLKDFQKQDDMLIYKTRINWDEWCYTIDNSDRGLPYGSLVISIWWNVWESYTDLDYSFYNRKDKRDVLKMLNEVTMVAERQLKEIKSFIN